MKKLLTLLVVIGILTSCEKNDAITPNPPVAVADSVAILGGWLKISSINPWFPDTIFRPLEQGDSLFYTFTADSLFMHGNTTPSSVHTYSLDTLGVLYIYELSHYYSISNDTLIVSAMAFDGNEDTFIKF